MSELGSGPLDGIKVVDMSVMIAGPLAAMMLGDQGADVVKVEAPWMGDMMHHLGTSTVPFCPEVDETVPSTSGQNGTGTTDPR